MGLEVIVDAPAALARVFRARFERAAEDAVASHGAFSCALPGGSVAEEFFPALRAAAVDWSRVDVFWGDERAVGPDDPDANSGLARRLWLDHVPLDPARVHRMRGEDPDLARAAAAYADTFAQALGGRPLDLVLLGMGPEGHVCSLFPGHAALDEATRSVLAVLDSPKPPPRRLTLTLIALARAGLVCAAAFGAEKAAVARQAIAPDSPLPVARALRGGRRALVLLDAEAASQLEEKR